jgi:hypothetical protein
MNALLRKLADSLARSWVPSLAGIVAGVALLSALLPGSALAQVPDRVGRIAYLAGDVQFYSETAQAWLPAQLNAPVSSRNSLFTGPDGRAEIRFGSTAVALDRQTQLDIQLLDNSSFKAAVPRGSISLRVPRIEGDEAYEVTAAGTAYSVLQAGHFRVDAADNGSSVTVLAGLVSAALDGGNSVMVEPGQALSVADGDFVRRSARSSALDNWAAQRDNAYRSNRSSQSARYVSSNMTGYEELDANGRWAADPDYGNVWYPTTYVTAGWAPYRDGRWAYVAPWGWTWIDAAPWGFAPFHYGRWVLIGHRWAWMPGAYVRRPSYAPALVGFIGGSSGGNVAISISIGTQPAVGWYPLPPWERYRPAYAHHDVQLRNVNNFSISKPPSSAWRTVEQRRVSANQAQGATVVPREAFVDSRPVRRATLSVAAPVLAAPQAVSAPIAAPTRPAMATPSAGSHPESGDRRGTREAERVPADGNRGSAVVSPQAVPTRNDPRFGNSRSENREGRERVWTNERGAERQPQPATVIPQRPEPVSAPRAVSVQPAPVAPSTPPESRSGAFRGENRGAERQAPPVIVAPQPSPPVSAPRVDSTPARQFVPPAAVSPEQPVTVPSRRERNQPVDVPTPRAEQRIEPRAVQRVEPPLEQPRAPRVEQRPEPRVEPRPEPRQMQRAEPPAPVHVPAAPPAAQAEQRRAPEPGSERERRPHGERDKDKER